MEHRISLSSGRLRVVVFPIAYLLMAPAIAPAGAVSSSDVARRDLDATRVCAAPDGGTGGSHREAAPGYVVRVGERRWPIFGYAANFKG
jgi:hypothetical protein